MKFSIECSVHGSPVIPAGDELHFLPAEQTMPRPDLNKLPPSNIWTGVYELDWADLYCTGGEGNHKFYIAIADKDGWVKAMIEEDGSYLHNLL